MNMTYALVTAARNEASYIQTTIETVLSQTVLPVKWMIVSDGSTDRTDEIVKSYALNHNFIRFLRIEPDRKRNFASKVFAIRAALNEMRGIRYQILGNLDADVSFKSNYYEFVLRKFSEIDSLGIVGGVLFDFYNGKVHKQRYYDRKSVSGAVQTFRRQCYEEMGGYFPLESGGEDTVAEVTARMNGWQTQSFFEIPVLHHRRTGMANMNIYAVRFDEGYRDAMLGGHPAYQTANCAYRMVLQTPYIVGGVFRLFGFFWAMFAGGKRKVSREFVNHLRREQIDKIKALIFIK